MTEPEYINAILCHICGDIVFSISVHDYNICLCGNVAVDGGYAYGRRVFQSDEWEDIG